MKKLLLIIISITLIFSLTACKEEEYTNISYEHSGYFIGKCDEFKLIVTCGKRESPYIADGEAGDMVEFTLITLKPLNASATGKSYTYNISIDGEEFRGALNKDVFGSSFSKDVGIDISEKLSAITISDGDREYPIELENMMSNAIITPKDAIKISINEFNVELSQFEKEGKSNEIYLKFVCDSTGDESFYYWYVAHVFEGGKHLSVLLDIVSGDIIAKRP